MAEASVFKSYRGQWEFEKADLGLRLRIEDCRICRHLSTLVTLFLDNHEV